MHAPLRSAFVNIGERTNVTGSARFKKLVMAGDYATAVERLTRLAGIEPMILAA